MMGPFVHLEFPDTSDPDVVLLENGRAPATFIDDPAITGVYQEVFYHLEDAASPAAQLATYVERALGTIEGVADVA
jgi:hypothetical protein